jgi:hypothetical protein
VAQNGAEQRFLLERHCARTNGEFERLNRAFGTEWAHQRPSVTHLMAQYT